MADSQSAATPSERSTDFLAKKFPKLFSGKLGLIKDVKIKLEIDETVKPVRQAQRPIPFHLRDAVERELLRQEAAGIIERVTAKHGPTTWVANLVMVAKDKAIKNAKCSASRFRAPRRSSRRLFGSFFKICLAN